LIEPRDLEAAIGRRERLRYVTIILAMKVKCPHCGREAEYEGNEFRPFCSERCKLLDLGAWADEDYKLPTESAEMTENDVALIEKALEEKHRQ